MSADARALAPQERPPATVQSALNAIETASEGRTKVLRSVWSAAIVIGIAALIVLAVAVALWTRLDRLESDVQQVRTVQETGSTPGLKVRALICDAIRDEGKPLPSACDDPQVRQYMK